MKTLEQVQNFILDLVEDKQEKLHDAGAVRIIEIFAEEILDFINSETVYKTSLANELPSFAAGERIVPKRKSGDSNENS